MNIYIGYKYRNFADKENLKQSLFKISEVLENMGHKTFILGRDKFNWHHHGTPSNSILPTIQNMIKTDVFLAVVECESKSNGLTFESLCSKLLRKKMILAVKNGVTGYPFTKYTKNIVKFNNYEDIPSLVESFLK